MDAHGARDIDDGAAHGMQGEEAATVRLVERDAWIRRPLEEPSKATVPSVSWQEVQQLVCQRCQKALTG